MRRTSATPKEYVPVCGCPRTAGRDPCCSAGNAALLPRGHRAPGTVGRPSRQEEGCVRSSDEGASPRHSPAEILHRPARHPRPVVLVSEKRTAVRPRNPAKSGNENTRGEDDHAAPLARGARRVRFRKTHSPEASQPCEVRKRKASNEDGEPGCPCTAVDVRFRKTHRSAASQPGEVRQRECARRELRRDARRPQRFVRSLPESA